MEQQKENCSIQEEIKDSPSNNTRAKGSKGRDQANMLCSPSSSDSTPINKQSFKTPQRSARKPTPSGPDPGGSGRRRIAEVRAAALRKKREEIAKGSLAQTQQVVYDPDATAHAAKTIIKRETGLFMDELMERHYSPWDKEHIEKPERLSCIRKRLRQLGLIDRCKQLPCRYATDEELLLIHSEDHLNNLKNWVELPTNDAKSECNKLHSVYINEHSLDAVRLAAGSAIQLTNDIIQGKIQNGMCVVRPPGHHAMKSEPCGFCLCNNVAIAAKFAISNSCMTYQDADGNENLYSDLVNRKEPVADSLVRRVLIVDLDVHHGQGTQYAFYDDPNIYYFSIHRYENGLFWPNLRESDFDSVGEGKGIGYNANLPLNSVGMSDIDYMAIFHQILLPLAHEFQPDLVLVSAGYDAAIGDPEGEMRLSPAVYGHMIHALMSFASGKIAVVLEGGYFLESLADGVAMTLRALLGDFNISLSVPITPPKDTLVTSVLNLKCALKAYWNNLRLHDEYENNRNDCDDHSGQIVHISSIVYRGDKLQYPLNYNDNVYEPGDHYFKHTTEKENAFQEEFCKIRQQYDSVIERHRFIKPKRLALAYDQNLMAHRNIDDNNHPEKPERVEQIFQTHKDYGLLSRVEVMRVQSKRATKEDICLVHDEDHWNKMSEIPDLLQDELDMYAVSLDSIYLNPNSFDCALLAAGNVIQVVDAVLNEEAEKGVAIIRPPGHHAESDEACGFCIFNNAAVAAKYACQSHDLKRVLIVDWDVHHGNGIQNIFYTSSNVLYISLHRYDNGTFFPGRPDGNVDFVGSGQGKGFNVNIPWNGSGMGDTEYAMAFYNIVLPIAYEYNPELVLVSAGFDAARGDPLGRCKVSPEMFAHMTHHLSALANGKIILILEGGYNLNSISLSMTLCTKALLGDPLPPLAPYKIPLASAMETIRNVIRSYSAYWCCIKSFDCILPKSIKPDVKDGSHLLSKLEHDARNVNDGVELNGERDTIWYTDTIVETIPKLEDEDANVNIYDELVKDTEYIPSEYGHSVGTTGTNTISKQFVYVADAPRTQTLTDSQDDGSSSKSFAAENIQRTSMSYPIQCTPLSLTKHFEDLTLTSSQKQVLSMPELSSAAGDSNTDSNPGNQAIQLQGEYIPFQYGSYPGSRSVSTFTTSISSGHSLSTTTKTTDSKS